MMIKTSKSFPNCIVVFYRSFSISYVLKMAAVDLAYKTYGKENIKNRYPIITHHGLLGSKKNWESVSNQIAVATKRTVIAVDSRNHGQSPHTSTHTYGELASDISNLMSKLGIKEAVVIGHSMGGRAAMVLALTEPSKVAGLVVVDISPVQSEVINDFMPHLLNSMDSVDFKGTKNVSEAKAAAREKLKAADISDGTMDFIVMNIGKKPDNTFGWIYNVKALKDNISVIAAFPQDMHGKTYKGPTLFVGGERSPFIPPSDLAGIQIYFPAALLKYIPGVGHNVHAQNPGAFVKMVLDFLVTVMK